MAKIGIEWVKKYHGRSSDLKNTKKQAEGFYNNLSGTRSFNWGNDLAWDQDFEESGVGSPATGTDTTWADSVDIAFFSGHGSQTGPSFGVDNLDDGTAKHTEVRWGNKSLKWIAFDACLVLKHATPSFTGGIDAAVCGTDRRKGKAYFFKGNYYLRYDWDDDYVDANYPKRIAGHWDGFPSNFTSGIDAAVLGDGPRKGKAYFFKGNQYVRFDWDDDRVDSGYPKSIAGHWDGFPSNFTSGLNAGLYGDKSFSGKAYFFKGDQYVRFDWDDDRVDSGYPKSMAGLWYGWPTANDDVFNRWRNAFAGLHYILGFHSPANDESNRGRYFAQYLDEGKLVRVAWKKACQETAGSSTTWAYLRADGSGTDTYNDHWIGKGYVSPDPTSPFMRAYLSGSC
ncbi:MAG: DUF6345 domain-containing protein [Candidatus Odinarchaeota archaeon]